MLGYEDPDDHVFRTCRASHPRLVAAGKVHVHAYRDFVVDVVIRTDELKCRGQQVGPDDV